MKKIKSLFRLVSMIAIFFSVNEVYAQIIDAVSISARIKEQRQFLGKNHSQNEIFNFPFRIKLDFSGVTTKTCGQLHESLEKRKATISNAMTYLNKKEQSEVLDVDHFLALFEFSAAPQIKQEVKITVTWDLSSYALFLVNDPALVPDDYKEFEIIGPGMQWDGKNYLLPPFLQYQDRGDVIEASYKMSILDFCFGRSEIFMMPKRIKFNWTLSAHWRSELHIADQRGVSKTAEPVFFKTINKPKLIKDKIKGSFPVPQFGLK